MAYDAYNTYSARDGESSPGGPRISTKIVVALTKQAGKPMEPVLVNAIKAEYSHFSASGMINTRPRADSLRGYFAELSRLIKAKGQ